MKKFLSLFFLIILIGWGCEKEKNDLSYKDGLVELRSEDSQPAERSIKGKFNPTSPAPGAPCSLGEAGFGAQLSGTISGNHTLFGKY